MKFDDLPNGQAVFLDANPLIDHFSANPRSGPAAQLLLRRIANQDIEAFTSTHILGEMVHRLMTIEACAKFGWPYKSIAQRLANHPDEVKQLSAHRHAIDDVVRFGVQVLSVLPQYISSTVVVISQDGLLYNDALAVALMRDHGLTNLASSDTDFDRVPGITRYGPV